MDNRYMLRGVSAAKEDVHNAIKNIDKGIYPQAFCKIIPDILGNDPEYWGLAGVVTDEMADVALKMKVRKPKTTAQIAAITGKSEDELEKLLTEMAYIGLVEYNWENLDGKNPNHEKR